jgi:hypothetical protein
MVNGISIWVQAMEGFLKSHGPGILSLLLFSACASSAGVVMAGAGAAGTNRQEFVEQYGAAIWNRVITVAQQRAGTATPCSTRESCLAVLAADSAVVGDTLPGTTDSVAIRLRTRYVGLADELDQAASYFQLIDQSSNAAEAWSGAGVVRLTLREDRAALERLGRAYLTEPSGFRENWLRAVQTRLKDERVKIVVFANPPSLPFRMRLGTEHGWIDKTATDTIKAQPGGYIFEARHPVTQQAITKTGICANDYDCRIDFRF